SPHPDPLPEGEGAGQRWRSRIEECDRMSVVDIESAVSVMEAKGARRARGVEDFDARVSDSLDRAVGALFRKQHDDGHWCAELEGCSIPVMEYLLRKVILGQPEAPAPPGATPRDIERFRKMLVYLRWLQREDGTWGQYPGSPADLSACVKAYFTLKLFGEDV